MKTKHTKGKWIIYPNSNLCTYPGIEAIGGKHGNFSIVCMGEELTGVQGHTKEETMANAKLIASAPELLEALNHLCETMRPHIMKLGIKKGFSEHAALAQAQTAIHKAIG
jgi:hypothetical protein